MRKRSQNKHIKNLRFTIYTIIVLMISFIAFYTFNLIFSVVSNYESLDKVSLVCLPLFFIFLNLITMLFGSYRYFLRKKVDLYFIRQYAITNAVFSILGITFSIIVGSVIYQNYLGDNVFPGYPLVCLIVNILFFLGSLYSFNLAEFRIVNEHQPKMYKITFLYALRTVGLAEFLIYALNRLGAFLLIPVYYSDSDGWMTIPYLLQLVVPAIIFASFLVHQDFNKNKKQEFIINMVLLGYTLFSLTWMLCFSIGKYPQTLNSISAIQQFERLIKYPIDFIFLYGISLIVPILSLIDFISKKKKRS